MGIANTDREILGHPAAAVPDVIHNFKENCVP